MFDSVLVAGSVHYDILSTSQGGASPGHRVGMLSITVGGTAHNIAVYLTKRGAKVRFMTALNDSPFSTLISSYLKKDVGLETHVTTRANLPMAGMSAHVNEFGEVTSSVSSTTVDLVTWQDNDIMEAVIGMDCVVIDCNLSQDAIQQFVRISNMLSVPIFIAGVSDEKVLRVVSPTGEEEQGEVAAMFMTRREADFLSRHTLGCIRSPQEVAERLRSTLVISREPDDVLVSRRNTSWRCTTPGAEPILGGLGVQDFLTAHIIHFHVFGGMSLEASTQRTVELLLSGTGMLGPSSRAENVIEQRIGEISKLASTDSLTSLFNRAAVESRLAEEVGKMHRKSDGVLSLAIIDIDHFKSINDEFGHPQGDRVIARVARVISECTRRYDIAGRWGGEEFVCVFPNTPLEVAVEVVERIRTTIMSLDDLFPHLQRRVTVSAGVAECGPEESYLDALSTADVALYRAKHSGRNRVEAMTKEESDLPEKVFAQAGA